MARETPESSHKRTFRKCKCSHPETRHVFATDEISSGKVERLKLNPTEMGAGVARGKRLVSKCRSTLVFNVDVSFTSDEFCANDTGGGIVSLKLCLPRAFLSFVQRGASHLQIVCAGAGGQR